jgi:hypothetical protein
MASTNQRGSAGRAGGRGATGAASASSSAASAAMRGAMMPDEDVQTRFLREMALRLPLDRVVEAHVFPPIRQGGAETGVAVIAVRREDAGSGKGEAVSASDSAEPAVELGAPVEAGGAPPHGEVANDSSEEPYPSDATVSVSSHEEPPAESDSEAVVEAQAADAQESETQTQEGQPDDAESSETPAAAHADGAEIADSPPAEPPALSASRRPLTGLPERHTVFSARYRLTLKGPDRGKWEVDVVEEADAPLVTVDAVVRGVQRRAGEGADAERFTAEQLRALLEEPAAP